MFFKNEFSFLSNMYPSSINYNAMKYTCVESAFQAQKCINRAERIMFEGINGKDAKQLGKQVALRNDWEMIKVNVMKKLIDIKFLNPELAKKLITVNEPIIEHNTCHDNFWGSCTCEQCRHKPKLNKLGKILEEKKLQIMRGVRAMKTTKKENGVYIGNFQDINDSYDEVWAIVRSLNKAPNIKTNIRWMPILSPSQGLFYWYLNQKNKSLWNNHMFKEGYVPTFLKEMKGTEQRKALNYLYKKSSQQSILLVCFCNDEATCHRSIIAGMLQGVKANVQHPKDYSKYFEIYKSLQ